MPNFGVLIQPPQFTDYRFGGVTGIDDVVLQPDGDWSGYLPVGEYQTAIGKYDTLACVSFSALNCLEILFKKKFGVEANFSDRFTARMSGTTELGNYLYKVGDSIRKDGVVPEVEWPNLPWPPTRNDYYSPVPYQIQADGQEFMKKYRVAYEIVDTAPSNILAALKIAPLQVVINNQSHAVVLIGAKDGEYKKFFDTYGSFTMTKPWDFPIDFAFKYSLNQITVMPPIGENFFVFLAEGPGAFALKVGNSLLIDELAKVEGQFIMRNNGDIKGKTVSLNLADWNKFTHKNLKGEIVP